MPLLGKKKYLKAQNASIAVAPRTELETLHEQGGQVLSCMCTCTQVEMAGSEGGTGSRLAAICPVSNLLLGFILTRLFFLGLATGFSFTFLVLVSGLERTA